MQNNLDPNVFYMMLNMMNNIHPNMGYNINNYNINNNTQILMNEMMNWIQNNPYLLQIYNNMNAQFNNNNQFNNNQFNNNQFNNNLINNNSQFNNNMNRNQANFNNVNSNNNEQKINVIFITQKGEKIAIDIPHNMKIKDLLIKYVIKMGLGPDILKNDSIYFMYNGLRIDRNENKTVDHFFLLGSPSLLVIDTNNIIGA